MTTGPTASESTGAPGPKSSPPVTPAPTNRSRILTVLTAVFLGLSVLGNAILLVIVFVLAAALTGSAAEDNYVERTLIKGPSSQKIAVIHVDGVIYEEMVEPIRKQLVRAALDSKVKAVIVRINSPGGGLTASDMLHHEVESFASSTRKPVIAAMDSVAASGGYFIACAADKIVAQQTTITGSIGVIAQFFFLNDLLTDKLGITPVTLKVGEQKDWPNLFAPEMTPEQGEYLMNTLLVPGYNRFVDVVARSRQMKRDKVLKLATGRVFLGKEAQENGLIDEIGYFDRAVEIAKQRAGIEHARVVEYIQPFSLMNLLGVATPAKTLFDLKPEKLASLASPKIMYLWTGN